MKLLRILFFAAIAAFMLSGCAGNYMVKVPNNKIKETKSDKATIVFMRSSFVSSAIGAKLFEVNDGKLSFIGFLSNDTKIVHKTAPGKKVYMAVGYAADFMIADVRSEQTYYSIVRPNWGTGGFAPTPIRTDGTTDYNTGISAFKRWINLTQYEMKPVESTKWFEENIENYSKIYTDYWSRFQLKAVDEKAQRTLSPLDSYELNEK